MPWLEQSLRGKIVFVRANPEGQPLTDKDGKVDVVYSAKAGSKIYRAYARNLESGTKPPVDLPELDAAPSAEPGSAGKPVAQAADIIIYTDGACTGNPGPMGIGVVILRGSEREEISEYLGEGTNNIAELTAILRALERIPAIERKKSIVLHTDSMYSIGLLRDNWKAKKNQELVAEIRALVKLFTSLRFVHVRGHAGVVENERCDVLATSAIDRRR